jgi:pyridoxine 4-dehydrogenase
MLKPERLVQLGSAKSAQIPFDAPMQCIPFLPSKLSFQCLRQTRTYKHTAVIIQPTYTPRLTNGVASTCAELGITLLAYAPLSKGFLTGQIKRFEDLPEDDMRRMYPRFQPEVFDENMKLVDEVRNIAERKGCTVSE